MRALEMLLKEAEAWRARGGKNFAIDRGRLKLILAQKGAEVLKQAWREHGFSKVMVSYGGYTFFAVSLKSLADLTPVNQ